MRQAIALLVAGLILGAIVGSVVNRAPLSGQLMAIVVWSDGTAKSGAITADDCARLAELAYDGKVFKPREGDDEDTPFAMSFTCAPEALLKASFGRRHTP